MRDLITFLCAVVLFLLPAAVAGQDQGVSDTVIFEPTVFKINQSIPVEVRIVNDSQVNGIEMPIEFTTVDSGFLRFDSVVFSGRFADPNILGVRVVNTAYIQGDSPDTLLLAFFNGGPGMYKLPPGNDVLFKVYFTGVSPGQVELDSCHYLMYKFRFLNDINKSYYPFFKPLSVNIIESDSLPVVNVPEGPEVTIVHQLISFEVEGISPEGYPVDLSLVSFREYDDSTVNPVNPPLFDNNNPGEFSWTPHNNDIGIWLAIFKAIDSAGNETLAEVLIQVLEDSNFMINFSISETEDAPLATDILSGNLDNDITPELFVPALPFMYTPSFSLYDFNNGSFTEVYYDDYAWASLGACLTYVDEDNYLDVVMGRCWVTVLPGNGDNTFDPVVTSSYLNLSERGGVITDFNGDAYIDYVFFGYTDVRIFSGRSGFLFDEALSISVSDTAVSINCADFNGDSWDDLAVGTRKGLDIYLNNGVGGYVKSNSYSQTFWSMDIEVTNQGSDFNNDNTYDLCIATPSVGGEMSELIVYLGNGDGSFAQNSVRTVKGQIVANSVGDFNNDGELDIAFINSSRKYLSIIFGNGTGNFLNERRYEIPEYNPLHMDCMDIDNDGDLDLVVSSCKYSVQDQYGSSLFLFKNELDPDGFMSAGLEIYAQDNAQIELFSPTGAVLTKVKKTMSSGHYFRRNLNTENNHLDAVTVTNVVENGAYRIKVSPLKNLPESEAFSLSLEMNDHTYRLARDAAIGENGYQFTIYPDGDCPVTPAPGEFLRTIKLHFSWPGDDENYFFELASDIGFTDLLDTTTVYGTGYVPAVQFPSIDSSIYYWRVRSADKADFEQLYSFNLLLDPTDVDDSETDKNLPVSYSLAQNYPNPFNPMTEILFDLPRASWVKLEVFNLIGQKVATLVDGQLAAGSHTIRWEAGDFASGVYLYRLDTEGFTATKKMILLK